LILSLIEATAELGLKQLASIGSQTWLNGALEAASAVKARIEALDLSALTGEAGLRFSLSMGIALYPEHGADAEALVKASAGLPLTGRARGGSLILFPEDEA